jgi:type IV pilus assembly protein PilO
MAKASNTNSKLAPALKKIEQLSKPQRIGIYVGTLVLILGLSIWLLFWQKKQVIDGLNVELAKVQDELMQAKKNAEELTEWRTKMKKKEVQYKTVMKALPEKEEIPTLLSGISEAGKDAGLEFVLFEPKNEKRKEFYAEIPVDIDVTGNYHQVATFFDKVSNLPRIVNIRNIKMVPTKGDQGGGKALKTTCQAVTYKFIENSGNKGAKKGGRKGQRK